MKRIYVVDDDSNTIHILQAWLQKRNYEVDGFSNSVSFFEALSARLPDAILMDVHLDNEDGRDICRRVRREFAERMPVILFSMIYPAMMDVEECGATDLVKRDATLPEIEQLLQKHIKHE